MSGFYARRSRYYNLASHHAHYRMAGVLVLTQCLAHCTARRSNERMRVELKCNLLARCRWFSAG